MDIRVEGEEDAAAIAQVHARAFRRPDAPDEIPVEVRLVEELRASPEWLPELSLIAADDDGRIVGHVVCTRAYVAPGGEPVLGLGPLGVEPHRQRSGIGSALMHAVLAAADERGETLVGLLGDPAYYTRFGFRPSTEFGIDPPEREWGAFFQVRPLARYRAGITGLFEYAAPFRRLS